MTKSALLMVFVPALSMASIPAPVFQGPVLQRLERGTIRPLRENESHFYLVPQADHQLQISRFLQKNNKYPVITNKECASSPMDAEIVRVPSRLSKTGFFQCITVKIFSDSPTVRAKTGPKAIVLLMKGAKEPALYVEFSNSISTERILVKKTRKGFSEQFLDKAPY